MTRQDAPTPIATFDLTVLDAPDPRALAEFYCAVLGWEIQDPSDWQEGEGPQEWVTIRGAAGAGIAFQLAPDHVPPTWPDNAVPQQFHLDLNVRDLDRAQEQVIALGARPTGLPLPERRGGFRVLLDPAGHPFCLCQG